MSLIKLKIKRPKNSKDKQIYLGMRLFLDKNGEIETRHRNKEGLQLIGFVVDQDKGGEGGVIAWLK